MGYRDTRKAKRPPTLETYHEDWRVRHETRLAFANQPDNVAKVKSWCQQFSAELVITAQGNHWQIYRPIRREGIQDKKVLQWAEWWPRSAKLVLGKKWRQGVHTHDVEQLIHELTEFALREKR